MFHLTRPLLSPSKEAFIPTRFLPVVKSLMLLPLISAVAALLSADDLPYPRSTYAAGSVGDVFVVSTTTLSHDDQVTLQTLAGVLARTAPRIYVIDSSPAQPDPSDTTVFWLRQLQAQTNITFSQEFEDGDLTGLLALFASNISGYVRYSGQTLSTNAALIRCAATPEPVVAVASNATASVLDSLGVPMVADLSNATPFEEFKRGAASLSKRVAVFQPDDGGKAQRLTDYAVFARAPIVEAPASGRSPEFQAVLANLDATRLNAAFGWGGDEHQWVAYCTRAGAVAHASDFASNLALLANVPRAAAPRKPPTPPSPPRPPPPPAAGPVHTVAFITSDGDNIQILQHKDFIDDDHYQSTARGSIPVGWSYAPVMAELMPTLLDWVRSNLTANDELSAGPSGVGYAFPSLFPPTQAAIFARVTAELMARSGERLLNVLGVTPSAESLLPLMREPSIDAVSYLTFGAARMGYAGLHGNVACARHPLRSGISPAPLLHLARALAASRPRPCCIAPAPRRPLHLTYASAAPHACSGSALVRCAQTWRASLWWAYGCPCGVTI